MELTGQCRVAFEGWYKDNIQTIEFTIDEDGNKEQYKIWVNQLHEHPNSMKYGVYVDFFDSVGISVDVEYLGDGLFGMIWTTTDHKLPCGRTHGFDSRPEARTAAIQKANEIYNERHESK